MPFQEIRPQKMPHPEENRHCMEPSELERIQQLPGNDVCVDCGQKKPDWGCVKNGVLFCFQCAGPHRGLGTHICFVRSVAMDAWTPQQLEFMKQGGNRVFQEYLSTHGVTTVASTSAIRKRYDNDVAELYRLRLAARVQGQPEPVTLPPKRTTVPLEKRVMQGFGSSPPPLAATPKHTQTAVWVAAGVATTAVGLYILSGGGH